jgi:hypothetical protein
MAKVRITSDHQALALKFGLPSDREYVYYFTMLDGVTTHHVVSHALPGIHRMFHGTLPPLFTHVLGEE